jgi:sulfate transport system substrate-binding protein
MRGRSAAACLFLALGMAPLAGCQPSRGEGETGAAATDRLTIGAYSVVREAFHDGVLPAFAADWLRRTGRRVVFEESYNASGAQSRAIASGFDADIAVLSLEGDIQRLVDAGLIDPKWNAGADRGIITNSLVVIGVRPGNPKSIHDWDDLARPGVSVLYPDPKTSGGARWNINAIYGAGLLGRGGAQAARDLLARVQANVVNMDASGRQSMATFERGIGDAVVTYENELVLQRKRTGVEVTYVIPPATLLIEGPAAVVDAVVKRHGNSAVAAAFLSFLRSPEAQAILADYGFRPVDRRSGEGQDLAGLAPLPRHLFTMAELGGWKAINKRVYGPGGVWDSLFTQREGEAPPEPHSPVNGTRTEPRPPEKARQGQGR